MCNIYWSILLSLVILPLSPHVLENLMLPFHTLCYLGQTIYLGMKNKDLSLFYTEDGFKGTLNQECISKCLEPMFKIV